MRLWLRLGDGGEYHSHDDLQSVADELAENCVEIDAWINGGCVMYGFFEGHNYVSLYWGDEEAELVGDLTADEKQELTRYLQLAKILRDANST